MKITETQLRSLVKSFLQEKTYNVRKKQHPEISALKGVDLDDIDGNEPRADLSVDDNDDLTYPEWGCEAHEGAGDDFCGECPMCKFYADDNIEHIDEAKKKKDGGEWSGLGMGPQHGSVYNRHEPKKRANKGQNQRDQQDLQRCEQLWNATSYEDRKNCLLDVGTDSEDAEMFAHEQFSDTPMCDDLQLCRYVMHCLDEQHNWRRRRSQSYVE